MSDLQMNIKKINGFNYENSKNSQKVRYVLLERKNYPLTFHTPKNNSIKNKG